MGSSISYPTSEHTVDLGPRGRVTGLQFGDKARRYAGLPYALPPTGAHRWRKPRPLPASFTYARPGGAPFDATAFRPPCPQEPEPLGGAGIVVAPGAEPAGWSEDCLLVNVWTPAGGAGPWPVLVWLHGGWFQLGSPCQDPATDATELIATADLGAVVVAIGYRLNVFGFLASRALADESGGAAAGNFGLWDQRLALEWVRDNIARFGGDAANVTLAGRSAGAYSVEAQLLHELRGPPAPARLFRRLFMASNAIPAQPRPVAEAEAQLDELCEHFDIPAGLAAGEKLARLRRLSAEELVRALPRLRNHTFRPVTDEAFVHSGMAAYVRDGSLAREFARRGMKLLVGEVRDEETLYAQYRGPGEAGREALLRQASNYYGRAAAERMLGRYARPGPGAGAAAWRALFGAAVADAQVRASTRCLVGALHGYSVPVSDIWRYRIDYRLSFVDEAVVPASLGVCHASDGPLWNFSVAQGPTSAERELMAAWARILVAFVRGDAGFDFGTRAIDDVKVATGRRTVEVQKDARYEELRRLGSAFLGDDER